MMACESELPLSQTACFSINNQKSTITILLRFDGRLIDQHDGNVVLHGVDALALLALQALRVWAVLECLLAGGTDQNFQEFFGKHNQGIVRHGMWTLGQASYSPQSHGDTEKSQESVKFGFSVRSPI